MQPEQGAPADLAPVWIVEDNPDYRETVQELIDAQDDLCCPHAFSSGEDLLQFLNGHLAPDALLLDIGLPGMDGIEVVKRVSGFAPATQMVMLTIHEDNERIFQAICSGACGYLLKTATPERILSAVREALRGGAPMTPQIARRVLNLFTQMHAPRWDYQLTERELDVLGSLVEGKTKQEMGKSLFLSPHTVDTHLRSIYQKLHVHSRTEAVVKALKERLVDDQ
jgi:DNA-binding NarL/FixJ family response regulator